MGRHTTYCGHLSQVDTHLDPNKMTLEHLSPENPPTGGLSTEELSSIGNLILVTQDINNKLANKPFDEKRKILKSCNVWVDDVILKAKMWDFDRIKERTDLLAQLSYETVWKL